MGPTKPILYPLTTPKTMNFPSELREQTFTTCLDMDGSCSVEKRDDEENDIAITPPPAYTEFLNTFNPIFSSPTSSRANFSKYMMDKPRPSPVSPPSSTTSTTFPSSYPSRGSSLTVPPQAPTPPYSAKSPIQIQRMRLPPPYVYTPVSESPRSAHPLRSPYSPSDCWRIRPLDSPASDSGNSFSVRHVVTTTVTYKRAPQLEPPPQGKRRRNGNHRNV
ncbi:uncharacterized protein BO95DRAFT_444384 [Aspergillus brunneoviolaceus CBS 621.78]|uniref:Uncharacterized protein n=1 Tax=Aspergillus brunneoviolaceus CBS 621.78 TaxID=1450534 RepID=A0ACD1G4X2_9EURO|nr:hypothetical protein BO95DRAFT_444384 [Aspergillus brunneoviolaceus CBS 621.78]RAH44282.1 hypothetical protein BO95DRAFT_444384 [Aspergillus brunneoviolaceus CBS 621.78]